MSTPTRHRLGWEQRTPTAVATPMQSVSFSRELRQVLQERNLLTRNTMTKVCSMLDDENSPDTTTTTTTPITGPAGKMRTSSRPAVKGVQKRIPFEGMDFGEETSSPANRHLFNTALRSPSYRNCMSSPQVERTSTEDLRLRAINEILTSEKTYIEHLKALIEYFVEPLKKSTIITEIIHQTLFGQVEMIFNLNQEFLLELEKSVENVAPAFLKMAPFFKLYSVYAFDYKTALVVLQDTTKNNSEFRRFLEQTESRPEVQRKLDSLMIEPIQRVPRYKLLLQQVLDYSSPADPDYKLLKDSIKEIEKTAAHINACVEDQEVTQVLIHLQNSLTTRMPNIVKPSRKVLLEGLLHKITRSGNELSRYCVLMSDIFMYGRALKERRPNTVVENSIDCSCIFPLKKCKVYELFPCTFKIACLGDGILLSASDPTECRAWVEAIQQAIDELVQSRLTLRKESSKRKPMRKKEAKNFEADVALSPAKKRSDYDAVFRSGNSSGSESEPDVGCMNRRGPATSKRRCASPGDSGGATPRKLARLGRESGMIGKFLEIVSSGAELCKRGLHKCAKGIFAGRSSPNPPASGPEARASLRPAQPIRGLGVRGQANLRVTRNPDTTSEHSPPPPTTTHKRNYSGQKTYGCLKAQVPRGPRTGTGGRDVQAVEKRVQFSKEPPTFYGVLRPVVRRPGPQFLDVDQTARGFLV